jgi:branched-chain amino acid transport system ATP-binding protein
MQPKPVMLRYEQIYAHYGAIQALRGVDLQICTHEIVTLIGANGAGKSTLMMSTFAQPAISSGRILFKNKLIHEHPTHEIAKMGLAISPEGRRVFPKLSVQENLDLGALYTDKQYYTKTLAEVFELFPLLKERAEQRAGTLSGGEQQMLAIGRALMSRPECFLLDEPSLGLAPQMVQKIFAVLREIADRGTTIFLVEQNANHALKLADRAYVMVNGQITINGWAKDLLDDPSIKAAYLGGH